MLATTEKIRALVETPCQDRIEHDDPDIAERRRGRQVKQAAEDAAGLTIAERLTRRAKAQNITITIPDDAGDLLIDMQIPTWKDVCELTQMEAMMETLEGQARIAEILGDLCQTDGLDNEFWKSGQIGLIDMRLVIEGLTTESAQRVNQVRSFRSK